MKKSIVLCVSILVIPTLAMGGILATGAELGSLEAFATPFLYLGCLIGWMIKGDNFASSHEFLWFGFELSIAINTVLGVLLGVIIARFGRLRAMHRAANLSGPEEGF